MIARPASAPRAYESPEVQAPAVVPVSPAAFMFEGAAVRVTDLAGNPWFVLADIAQILGYQDAEHAGRNVEADDKGTINVGTLGGAQKMTTINELGFYSLVLKSRKPEAKRFKRWVTGEVLPAIRKVGGYGDQVPVVNLHDPNTLRTLLLASTEREIAQAAVIAEKVQVIEQLAPNAAALDMLAANEGA